MSEFVQVTLSPIFRQFGNAVTGMVDELTIQGGKLLRQELETSIRERWYDTGATLASVQDELIEKGFSRSYSVWPTAVSRKGAPYPLFGEYGTGGRGSLTGRPAPAGYRYGQVKGIAARRYARIAVGLARPKVEGLTLSKVSKLAANLTTT